MPYRGNNITDMNRIGIMQYVTGCSFKNMPVTNQKWIVSALRSYIKDRGDLTLGNISNDLYEKVYNLSNKGIVFQELAINMLYDELLSMKYLSEERRSKINISKTTAIIRLRQQPR